MAALEQKIENIEGNWKTAFLGVEPGTALSAYEINQARMSDRSLCSLGFYTPDGEVYSVDEGIPTLRITPGSKNPLLQHIDDAFEQLFNTGNYCISETDFAAARDAADTVAINIRQLNLQGKDKVWGYVQIRTKDSYVWDGTDYVSANEEQSKLINRIYSSEYLRFIADKKKNGIRDVTETKIYVLKPDYVQERAKGGALGRASWLGYFSNYSNFDASVRDVYFNYRVRGVRHRIVPAGDAPKNVDTRHETEKRVISLSDHYSALSACSLEEAVAAIPDGDTAVKLLQLGTEYFSKRNQ